MAEMFPNDRLGPVLGLEPRYLRVRRENLEPRSAAEEAETEPEQIVVWEPVIIARSMDAVTPRLRRRLQEVTEENRRLLPPSVALPIMFGLSGILWLTLGWIADAVTLFMAPH